MQKGIKLISIPACQLMIKINYAMSPLPKLNHLYLVGWFNVFLISDYAFTQLRSNHIETQARKRAQSKERTVN